MANDDQTASNGSWMKNIDLSKVYTGPGGQSGPTVSLQRQKPDPKTSKATTVASPQKIKEKAPSPKVEDHVLDDKEPLPELTSWQEEVLERVQMDLWSGVLWGPDYIKEAVATKEPTKEAVIREARLFAASCFLQHQGRFIDVKRKDIELGIHEVFRALTQMIFARFPQYAGKAWLPEKAIKEILEGVVDGLNADPRYAFGLFSGKRYMLPGNPAPRLYRDGYWDLNIWKEPSYRRAVPVDPCEREPLGAFGRFLEFAITDLQDRQVLLDWLTWSLHNEASKPSWAIFLFSEDKGTGKSTILRFARALFGEENCSEQNGVEGVTGRFPEDILNKKLITLEEVKLTSFSSAGNTLKEYITGTSVSVERKNRNERVRLPLLACFLLTSNHRPSWLEGGERRYYIIEVTHEGRAFGPRQDEFARLVSDFEGQIGDPSRLNRLYLELKARQVSHEFNPHVLRQQNRIMREMTVDDVNETDAVLEDLLDQYGVEIIPSSEQYLLVRHLRLKSDQELQARLRRLGFAPQKRRIEGRQVRLWMRKDAAVENGRVSCPRLSEKLENSGQHKEILLRGFVWWPLTTLIKRWDEFARDVLGAKRTGSAQEKGGRWSESVGSSESEENGKIGPYKDSTSMYSYWGGEGPYHSPLAGEDHPSNEDLTF